MSETALYSRASGHAGLSALVGTRIYPLHRPEKSTLPAVTFRRISTVRESAMGSDTNVVQVRYQLDAYASTVLEAKSVQDQIRAAFQRYRGTSAGVVVQDTFIEGQAADYDPVANIHRLTLDVLLVHEE